MDEPSHEAVSARFHALAFRWPMDAILRLIGRTPEKTRPALTADR